MSMKENNTRCKSHLVDLIWKDGACMFYLCSIYGVQLSNSLLTYIIHDLYENQLDLQTQMIPEDSAIEQFSLLMDIYIDSLSMPISSLQRKKSVQSEYELKKFARNRSKKLISHYFRHNLDVYYNVKSNTAHKQTILIPFLMDLKKNLLFYPAPAIQMELYEMFH